MSVAEAESLKDLIGETLDFLGAERKTSVLFGLLLHVFLNVVFTVFKDQMELLILINDFFELNDVRVLETFKKSDLSDGSGRDTIVFLL